MAATDLDVNSFLPTKSAKKRNKPSDEDDEEMAVVVDESGIEGKVKSSTSSGKAKRVKKADSMKIAVPIKRFVPNSSLPFPIH